MSGLEGRLLRPLSAQLLDPTIVEKEGLIARSKLLNISGRSRKEQIKLAEKWGITDYSQPAGGCLLTEKIFGNRTKDLFSNDYNGYREMISLKWGRHFRVNENFKAVLGRNEQENNSLIKYAHSQDYLMLIKNGQGPTLILKGIAPGEDTLSICGGLIKRYSKSRELDSVKIQYWKIDSPDEIHYLKAETLDKNLIESIKI